MKVIKELVVKLKGKKVQLTAIMSYVACVPVVENVNVYFLRAVFFLCVCVRLDVCYVFV